MGESTNWALSLAGKKILQHGQVGRWPRPYRYKVTLPRNKLKKKHISNSLYTCQCQASPCPPFTAHRVHVREHKRRWRASAATFCDSKLLRLLRQVHARLPPTEWSLSSSKHALEKRVSPCICCWSSSLQRWQGSAICEPARCTA